MSAWDFALPFKGEAAFATGRSRLPPGWKTPHQKQ
jgi:hypothetical protein